MTASKSLPARPSLESLRKQAKKFARDVAAGDAAAISRARAHLPNVDPPLTQRNAQLVIAREYGYPQGCFRGTTTSITPAFWEWPRAPMATPATRSEKSTSPARSAQSC
jgi:hypothetical protein